MTEIELEQMLAAAGCSAERVTSKLVDRKIKEIEFCRPFPEKAALTVCTLLLENGFTVVGSSACASLENFREELGKQLAFENAREKIWGLEGYLLKEKLFRAAQESKEPSADLRRELAP